MKARAGAAIAALALAATIVLPGCGSSRSGTDADPATVVPAAAPLYVSVLVEPKGGPTSPAQTAARKLTHLTEPYGRLAEALLAGGGERPRFKREIAPWAGERAGVFLTSLKQGILPTEPVTTAPGLAEALLNGALPVRGTDAFGAGGAQGAIVFDTSDAGRARTFLEAWARRRHAHAARYRGVAYEATPQDMATAIVKRFAVIGSESGVKTVIDTSLGAASLSSAGAYARPPANAVATAQLAPRQLAATAAHAGTSAQQGLAALGSLFAGAESASLAVTAARQSLTLEGQARYASAAAQSAFPLAPGGAQALAALPGGSWLAAGVGDVAATATGVGGLLRAVSSLGLSSAFSSFGGAGIERLLSTLGSPRAGLDGIFAGWAGHGGLFVSGTGLFNLQAALTIASSDSSKSKAAVGKLAALLRRAGAVVGRASIPGTDAAVTVRLTGFPAVLFIADGQGKLVLGLGQASVEGALTPTSTLSSSPSYQAAAQALGGGLEPSLIVEWPALLGFFEGLGLTQNPPFSKAVPYLRSLGTLTAGSTASGPTTRFRAVLGLA